MQRFRDLKRLGRQCAASSCHRVEQEKRATVDVKERGVRLCEEEPIGTRIKPGVGLTGLVRDTFEELKQA